MELITGLATNLLTSGLKKLVPLVGRLSKTYLRLIVAVLSLGTVIAATALKGGEIDALGVETFVEAIKTFAISQGAFFLARK